MSELKQNYVFVAEVIRCVDGDTVEMRADLPFYISYQHKFRLLGINAPEIFTGPPETRAIGQKWKAALEAILPVGMRVTVQTAKADVYGRWLATVYIGGVALTQETLENAVAGMP